MRRSLLAASCLVAALGLAVSGTETQAFRLESNLGVHPTTPVNPRSPVFTRFIHWDVREFPNCTVPYSINAAGCPDSNATGGFAALVNAANSWTNVAPAVLGLARQANSATVAAGQDNINLIGWDGGNAANTAFWGPPLSGTLALTCVWTQAASGRILESDIIFNDRDWQWNNTGDNFNNVTSGNTQPFALADLQTLQLRVDGGAVQTVTFNAANYANIAMATAAEVQAEMLAQLGGLWIATPGGAIRFTSNTFNGNGTIQVVGGTAAAAFNFPGAALATRLADIETVALHELGHFLGVAHSSDAGNEPNATYTNAVMYAFAPALGTKRVLTADDVAAMNFLYTPDYGDAPESMPDKYQTLTRSTTNGRILSGLQLLAPDNGPGHLFNDFATDSLKMEWLGDGMDDNAAECEARVTDQDLLDDGVQFNTPMTKAEENEVVVFIRYKDASRYDSANPARTLYFNGYFDFDSDKTFTSSDREIWWKGDPTNGTLAASANWTLATYSAGLITLHFDVIPSLISDDQGWARFRLDVGEDEGNVNNWNQDLARALGVAQFGEVEDYRYALQEPPVQVALPYLDAEVSPGAVQLAWSFPAGTVDVEEVRLYRREQGSEYESLLATVRTGAGESPGGFVDADVRPGASYTYRLGLYDGVAEVGGPSVHVIVPGAELALYGLHPNPTTAGGAIRFSLSREGTARLDLFAVNGRRVARLLEGVLSAGPHEVQWSGQSETGARLPAGVYLLRLTAEGETRTERVILAR